MPVPELAFTDIASKLKSAKSILEGPLFSRLQGTKIDRRKLDQDSTATVSNASLNSAVVQPGPSLRSEPDKPQKP
jgi:hypothetical protein